MARQTPTPSELIELTETIDPNDPAARGLVLHRLGVRFKSGFSVPLSADNLRHLDQRRVDTVDLIEAGERIAATRTVTTYPLLGDILALCRVCRLDRLAADRKSREHEEELQSAQVQGGLAPEDIAHFQNMRLLGKSRIFWCPICEKYGAPCDEHYLGPMQRGYAPAEHREKGPQIWETAKALDALEDGSLEPGPKLHNEGLVRGFTKVGAAVDGALGKGIRETLAYVATEREKREARIRAVPAYTLPDGVEDPFK